MRLPYFLQRWIMRYWSALQHACAILQHSFAAPFCLKYHATRSGRHVAVVFIWRLSSCWRLISFKVLLPPFESPTAHWSLWILPLRITVVAVLSAVSLRGSTMLIDKVLQGLNESLLCASLLAGQARMLNGLQVVVGGSDWSGLVFTPFFNFFNWILHPASIHLVSGLMAL